MIEIPEGLGERGSVLWSALQGSMEFDPQEEALLLETCRTLDTIEALALSIDSAGVMIVGSQGQQVLNPAVGELRQQQLSYARLVTMLNLDAVEGGTQLLSATTANAQAAANARWSKVRKAKRG
jgi:hypothetical protein